MLALCATLAATTHRADADDLPPDVAAAIRKTFASPDAETRYLAGRVDLDGDGKDELLVHVVGMTACGSGGCPTLVFTPTSHGYRRLTTISVSRTPIRVAATRSKGWRNLIVHVAGGGTKARDVELAFDGTSYPSNPTVAGPRVTTARTEGAETVIADFDDFTDATPLPTETTAPPTSPAAAAAPPAKDSAPAAAGPSFDCAKAASPVEKAVCRDRDLASLDRRLSTAYAEAMRAWPPEEQTKQRAAQRAWMTRRDTCGRDHSVARCVSDAYRHRLVEVQIQGGQLEAPTPVDYACEGHDDTPLTVSFYRQTDPASVVLTFGDRQAIAMAEPSGSGAHYVGAVVDFWEHHGEATMTWSGAKYVCKAR